MGQIGQGWLLPIFLSYKYMQPLFNQVILIDIKITDFKGDLII